MKRLNFKITFITDVIINSTAATEGNNKTLEYIPGAAILGIAAQKYKSFESAAFEVFHSEKVRFSDAHPFQSFRSFRIPASYFLEKGDSIGTSKPLIIHHQITPSQKEHFRENGIQLKQQRSGFLVNEGKLLRKIELIKDFSIKSAYDRKTRRAKDQMMFGYEYLKSGSEWSFYVEIYEENTNLSEKIKNNLIGTQKLGRSKTAEFGLIEVNFEGEETVKPNFDIQQGSEIVLYAESLLAFVNEFGLPTLTPQALDFGIEGEICWEKSQVLARSFSPYNSKRATREADRVCIDKGSVFVIKVNGAVNEALLMKGVGLFLNEGFGEIQVNPDFLTLNQVRVEAFEKPLANETKQNYLPIIPEHFKDIPLLKYLHTTAQAEQSKDRILQKVDDFITNHYGIYRKIKPSQWGGIRERASRADGRNKLMELLFGEIDGKVDKEKGYLTHGVAAIDWNERNRLSKLKEWISGFEENERPQATSVLAAAMAKKYNQKNEKK
jgi:hypothetical protein